MPPTASQDAFRSSKTRIDTERSLWRLKHAVFRLDTPLEKKWRLPLASDAMVHRIRAGVRRVRLPSACARSNCERGAHGELTPAIGHITDRHDKELREPGASAIHGTRRRTAHPSGTPRESERHLGASECLRRSWRHGPARVPVAFASWGLRRVLGGDSSRQLAGDLPVRGWPCRRC